MLILQKIKPAINLKKTSREKTTLQVFFILLTMSASPLPIYGTLLLPLANSNSKKNTICGDSQVFMFILMKLQALLSRGLPSHVHKSAIILQA